MRLMLKNVTTDGRYMLKCVMTDDLLMTDD
jgi:hypothetical protein